MVNLKTTERLLFYLILSSFSFVFMGLVDLKNSINYFQFFTEILCFILLFFKYRRLNKTSVLLFLLVIVCWGQYFFNPSSFRSSTVLYTVLFASVFFVFSQVLKKNVVQLDEFVEFIKLALIIYSVVLLVQQIQSLSGLIVFNLNSDKSSRFKLNSLSWESSNLSLLVPAYFFVYIKCREIQLRTKYSISRCIYKDKIVWFCFLYLCLTCGSMSGLISVCVTMSYFINKKNIIYVVMGCVLAVMLVPLLAIFDVFKIERLYNLWNAVLSMDYKTIIIVDASAACRIIPYWVYVNSVNFADWHFWLGHGIDQAEIIAKNLIISDYFERNIGATNITSFFYNYGLISTFLFMKFLKQSISKHWLSFKMFFYFALFSIVSLNHHVLWLFIFLMVTLKFFEQKYYYEQ